MLKTCRTPQALYIHTHTKHSCANKRGPTGSYTQAGSILISSMWCMYPYTHIFRGRQTSHTHSIHARGWHLWRFTCLDDMLRSRHCASRNRRSRRSLGVSPAPVSACKAKVNLLWASFINKAIITALALETKATLSRKLDAPPLFLDWCLEENVFS